MNYLEEDLKIALKDSGSVLHGLSILESKFFRKKVSEKFGDGETPDTLFWTHLKNTECFSIRHSKAREWLDEFLMLEECYIFFEMNRDPSVFIFPENQSIKKFFSEFPLYTFYLTNENLDFLIFYNDHEYFAAFGTAESWLRQKAISLSKTGWKDMDGRSWE